MSGLFEGVRKWKRDAEEDVGGWAAYHQGVGFVRGGDGALATTAKGLPLEHARCHTHIHTHTHMSVFAMRGWDTEGEAAAPTEARERASQSKSSSAPPLDDCDVRARVRGRHLRQRASFVALGSSATFFPSSPSSSTTLPSSTAN